LDDEKREPYRFRVALRADMGTGCAAGKESLGFIASVLGLITTFYGQVVQDVAPWQPPAPKLAKPSPVPEPEAVPEIRPDLVPPTRCPGSQLAIGKPRAKTGDSVVGGR
jgi:hypothetical protein